jgi:small subunit ribosomal protein S10
VHNLPSPPLGNHVPITPKHGIHVATLHLRSHTTELEHLAFFTSFALRAARALGLPTSGVIALPTKTSLFTVPRSPFAHKKSQENFWRKEHKRAIKVYDGNEEIVQAWLAYLRKEAMGGVGMKAQVITYRPFGWGQTMVGTEMLRQSAIIAGGEDAAKVKSLAEELVEELSEMVDETAKVQAAQSIDAGDVQAPAVPAPVDIEEITIEVVSATEEPAKAPEVVVEAVEKVEEVKETVVAAEAEAVPEPIVVAEVEVIAAVEEVKVEEVKASKVKNAKKVVEAKKVEEKVEAAAPEPAVVEPVVAAALVVEPVVAQAAVKVEESVVAGEVQKEEVVVEAVAASTPAAASPASDDSVKTP